MRHKIAYSVALLFCFVLQAALAENARGAGGAASIRPVLHERVKLARIYYVFEDRQFDLQVAQDNSVPVGSRIHVRIDSVDDSFEVSSISLERKGNGGAPKGQQNIALNSGGKSDFVLDVSDGGDYRLIISARRIMVRHVIFPKSNYGIDGFELFAGGEPMDGFSCGDQADMSFSGDLRLEFDMRNGYSLHSTAGAQRNRNAIIISEDIIRGLDQIDLNRYFKIDDHTKVSVGMDVDRRLQGILSLSYNIDYAMPGKLSESFDRLPADFKVGDRIGINWSVRNQGRYDGFMVLYIKESQNAIDYGITVNPAVLRAYDALEDNNVVNTQRRVGRMISISPISYGGSDVVVDESESIALVLKPIRAAHPDGSMLNRIATERYSAEMDPDFVIWGFSVREYISQGVIPIGRIRFKLRTEQDYQVRTSGRIWLIRDESYASEKEMMVDIGKWENSGMSLRDFIISSIDEHEVFRKVD